MKELKDVALRDKYGMNSIQVCFSVGEDVVDIPPVPPFVSIRQPHPLGHHFTRVQNVSEYMP